jgi:hypothetical protein
LNGSERTFPPMSWISSTPDLTCTELFVDVSFRPCVSGPVSTSEPTLVLLSMVSRAPLKGQG